MSSPAQFHSNIMCVTRENRKIVSMRVETRDRLTKEQFEETLTLQQIYDSQHKMESHGELGLNDRVGNTDYFIPIVTGGTSLLRLDSNLEIERPEESKINVDECES